MFSSAFIVFGVIVSTPMEIINGIYKIIKTSDILITDYIEISGIGAAFVNSGLLMLMSTLIMLFLKVDIVGISISSIFLMGSFALFGKNIFNVWFIIIGLILYVKFKKLKIKDYIHIGFFATSIAPIFTEILFFMDFSLWIRIPLAIFVSLSIGFIIVPLSIHMFKIHKGFNLYNTGFVVGILGTVYISIFKSFGYITDSKLIWSEGNDFLLAGFLIGIFTIMFMSGLWFGKKNVCEKKKISSYTGLICDFVKLEGFGATLKNMAINGFISMIYILVVGGPLNGPTLAGIITVSGFGAMGKHFKNLVPIFVGVIVGNILGMYRLDDPVILIAALFGTALSPISGYYGWIWGVLAGIINSAVVMNSGILHGGMNLYNTGFSAGIVAAVMVPFLEMIMKKKKVVD